LASRRRRRKSIGKVVSDVERRLRVAEKRPGAKRIKANIVTAEKIRYRTIEAKNIATDTLTPKEVSFPTNTASDTEPTEDLKAGSGWYNTTTSKLKVYDPVSGTFKDIEAVDSTARASADGKNTIYRQDNQPTGGTYVTGDTWFDTNDDNKIYRYNGTTWVGFTLGNNAIASISASKITAGTLDAAQITVSNLDAGSITTGTLIASRIAADTITGAMISATALNSKTITGSTIQTSAAATSRVILDASGLRAVDSSGNTKVNISTNGSITAEAGTIGGFSLSTQYLQGSGNIRMNADTGIITCASINASGISLNGNFSGSGQSMTIGAVTVGNALSADSLTVASTTVFSGASNSFPNITTSTAAANFRWGTTTSGRIFESTASSAKFKENIVDLSSVEDLDPRKLLNLPVRAFSYKESYLQETDERSGCMVPGFIAEEVDEIYTIAADFENGEPHNWNDKFIIPGMLALIQDQERRIKLLEEA
jgi:hypothetical protein